MSTAFETFVISMVNDVPTYLYVMLFILLCLVAMFSTLIAGRDKGLKISIRFAVVEYIFLIYSSTVFFRPTTNNTELHVMPFWSYAAYDSIERPDLLPENIMNIVVFIPLGILAGLGFKKLTWCKAMLIGLCISVSIELFQYLFKLGESEFDDVFHNSLGCVIGYGIQKLRLTFINRTECID